MFKISPEEYIKIILVQRVEIKIIKGSLQSLQELYWNISFVLPR